MDYQVREISGTEHAETLHRLNSLSPHLFPPLREHHLKSGHWFLIYHRDQPRAFAGLVPFTPFQNVGYLKRCWVSPEYRGRGWQKILLEERERKARELGWHMLVSEAHADNEPSISNFLRCGYVETVPEQIWAANSRYFVKAL